MKSREERLAWLLCAPAVLAMTVIVGYPLAHAAFLSLWRKDLRFPDADRFVGLENYVTVFRSEVWWQALANTAGLVVATVTLELVLGFALAFIMHRVTIGRRTVRAAVLLPYAITTVVAALAWKFAFDARTGFVNELFGLDVAWFSGRATAFAVIVATDVWKTTPFVALLLLAGLTLVPEDCLRAARVDGASATQRFFRVTLPLMKPAILVALLFRTLDAFRIFDSVFVQTRGAQGTETLSIVAYETLLVRLNLGLGSTVAFLVFAGAVTIAVVYVKGLGARVGEGAR